MIQPTAPAPRYYAFISYSHADKRWAEWLHKALETYAVPKRLVGADTAACTIPKRLAPIFRDRDELPSAHDLSGKVAEALALSGNLIVICSPRSATSRWVNEEVSNFIRLGRGERIFCLIIEGEPNATDLPGRAAEECFAPALRIPLDADVRSSGHRIEPIAADARPRQDGKANAKLKLIAGLLGVGFDDLRQREQQRRHRRLAWIAAFGLVGMAVMSVLAGVAVHERNQAVMQRQQAEDLIGFMLGNLRTKLEAVSRLDILNDVADHTLRYFEAEPDAGGLGSRTKRAEALLLLGRVRLDQGKDAAAKRAFTQSLQLSRAIVADGNHLPPQELGVVDAQFWLGTAAWQSGDTTQAMAHFQAALPIVVAVSTQYPDNKKALLRLTWLHTNIGHVFEAQGAWSRAMEEYTAELEVSQRMTIHAPHVSADQVAVAMAHDNIAALLVGHGDFAGAEQHYLAERAGLAAVVAADPRDSDTTNQLAVAQTFLAKVAESLGHAETARDNLRQAKAIGETALARDPSNMDSLGDLASYCRRLARNLRLNGEASSAAPLLERSAMLYTRMLSHAPTDTRGQYGLAATLLEQAQLAQQSENPVLARSRAGEAMQGFTLLLQAQSYARDASLGLASTQVLVGELDSTAGNAADARSWWSRALDAMRVFGGDSQDPDQISVQAHALTLLGRVADAQPLIARLDAMHYRDPAFVRWHDNAALAETPRKGNERIAPKNHAGSATPLRQ